MRLLPRHVRSLVLVFGLMVAGLPQHLAADAALIQRAELAAQFCFNMVETNKVDTAFLAKNGYVATNASKTAFVKKEMVQTKNLLGQAKTRKVVTGRIQLKVKPFNPAASGSYCKFIMPISENDEFLYLIPPLREFEKEIGRSTFMAVAEKAKNYKVRKLSEGLAFFKGDKHIQVYPYFKIQSTRVYYVLVKQVARP